jgi:hypothetical protein
MTPFSLSDLGLSDEEIAQLGLADSATTQPDATPDSRADEPEMTPFSLSDLGISDEEIAQFGLDDVTAATTPATSDRAPDTRTDEPDMTPFSLSELGLSDEEISALGLDDAQLSSTAEPETSSIEPQSSDIAEDSATSWDSGAEPVAPPEDIQESEPYPPAGESTTDEAEPAAPTVPPLFEPAQTPSRPAESPRRATQAAESVSTSTGNDILDAFLKRLDAEPENDVLRLSVARVSGQIGQVELALQQYKYLIKHNRLLGDIGDELRDLIDATDDRRVLPRLHRTLGDVYSKQGRLNEAIDEYSWRG